MIKTTDNNKLSHNGYTGSVEVILKTTVFMAESFLLMISLPMKGQPPRSYWYCLRLLLIITLPTARKPGSSPTSPLAVRST